MPPAPLHQQLIADEPAQTGFRRALGAVVKPGDVVLDAACGLGIHSVFACEAGASRVYAVDRGRIAALARQVIAANGLADRVTVFRGEAAEIEIGERVDVVVSHLSVFELVTLLPVLKQRFLRAGGSTIPARIEIVAAPVEAPEIHHAAVGFWRGRPLGVELGDVAREALFRTHDARFGPEQLLAPGEVVTVVDFAAGSEPWFRKSFEVVARRDGEIHGLGFWLTEWLADGISISNAPPTTQSMMIWPHFFLPARSPVAVRANETITLDLRLRIDRSGFVGEWSIGRGGERIRQTALGAASLSAPRAGAAAALRLAPAGEHRRFVLDACDGALTAAEVARRLRGAFPDRFGSDLDAERFVASVTDSLVVTD